MDNLTVCETKIVVSTYDLNFGPNKISTCFFFFVLFCHSKLKCSSKFGFMLTKCFLTACKIILKIVSFTHVHNFLEVYFSIAKERSKNDAFNTNPNLNSLPCSRRKQPPRSINEISVRRRGEGDISLENAYMFEA